MVRIDPDTKNVIVGPKEALLCPEIGVSELNWLDVAPLTDKPRPVQVKVRSTTDPVGAGIFIDGDNVRVRFDQPQPGVAPGQACVVYDEDRVLGGGWIVR